MLSGARSPTDARTEPDGSAGESAGNTLHVCQGVKRGEHDDRVDQRSLMSLQQEPDLLLLATDGPPQTGPPTNPTVSWAYASPSNGSPQSLPMLSDSTG